MFENELTYLSELYRKQDDILHDLISDLYLAAIKYTKVRMDWEFLTLEQKGETGKRRTEIHNHFLDCLNILNRYLSKNKLNTILTDVDDRKILGNFACCISCMIAIQNA